MQGLFELGAAFGYSIGPTAGGALFQVRIESGIRSRKTSCCNYGTVTVTMGQSL